MTENQKKLAITITLFLIGFALLNLAGVYYNKIQSAASRLQFPEYDIYRAVVAFIFFIIGILVEWKKVIYICTRGPKANFIFLIIALMFVIVPMIPYVTLMNIIDMVAPSPLWWTFRFTFESAYTRSALSMLGGIFLVRSLYNDEQEAE